MHRLLLAVAFAFFAPALVFAQSTTSSLTGTATDSTGALLSNAPVTVTNSTTGVQQQVKTDAQGTYRVGQLPPGNYSLKVETLEFQEQNVQNINLVVDQQGRQHVSGAVFQSRQCEIDYNSGHPRKCWGLRY